MTKEYYMIKQQLLMETLEKINNAWMDASMREDTMAMAYYKKAADDRSAKLEEVNAIVLEMMR